MVITKETAGYRDGSQLPVTSSPGRLNASRLLGPLHILTHIHIILNLKISTGEDVDQRQLLCPNMGM